MARKPDLIVVGAGNVSAQQMLQLNVDHFSVAGPDDLVRTLEAVQAACAQAIIVSPDALLYQLREPILRFARAARLPDMHFVPENVEAGGLISLSPSIVELQVILARMSDRLVKGARPAELPFEQPTRFEIVVNRKTAQSLGLTIPRSVLLRADRVIE